MGIAAARRAQKYHSIVTKLLDELEVLSSLEEMGQESKQLPLHSLRKSQKDFHHNPGVLLPLKPFVLKLWAVCTLASGCESTLSEYAADQEPKMELLT